MTEHMMALHSAVKPANLKMTLFYASWALCLAALLHKKRASSGLYVLYLYTLAVQQQSGVKRGYYEKYGMKSKEEEGQVKER